METEESNYLQKTDGKKDSVIMTSNFKNGTSQIKKGIASAVR
jgi:hypothetical protein